MLRSGPLTEGSPSFDRCLVVPAPTSVSLASVRAVHPFFLCNCTHTMHCSLMVVHRFFIHDNAPLRQGSHRCTYHLGALLCVDTKGRHQEHFLGACAACTRAGWSRYVHPGDASRLVRHGYQYRIGAHAYSHVPVAATILQQWGVQVAQGQNPRMGWLPLTLLSIMCSFLMPRKKSALDAALTTACTYIINHLREMQKIFSVQFLFQNQTIPALILTE